MNNKTFKSIPKSKIIYFLLLMQAIDKKTSCLSKLKIKNYQDS